MSVAVYFFSVIEIISVCLFPHESKILVISCQNCLKSSWRSTCNFPKNNSRSRWTTRGTFIPSNLIICIVIDVIFFARFRLRTPRKKCAEDLLRLQVITRGLLGMFPTSGEEIFSIFFRINKKKNVPLGLSFIVVEGRLHVALRLMRTRLFTRVVFGTEERNKRVYVRACVLLIALRTFYKLWSSFVWKNWHDIFSQMSFASQIFLFFIMPYFPLCQPRP